MKVRDVMIITNQTQSEFANLINKSQSYVSSKLKKDILSLSGTEIEQILDHTDLTFDDLKCESIAELLKKSKMTSGE